MSPPIDWTLSTSQIPPDGSKGRRQAGDAERQAIARALDVPECTRFELQYDVRPLGRDRYLMRAQVEAALGQTCVVTLEPVPAQIDETFSMEFWPPEEIAVPSSGEQPVLEGEDPEPIEGNALPIGRVAYEVCAAALDPYPRQAGANLPAAADPGASADRSGPFAVLEKWKPRGS